MNRRISEEELRNNPPGVGNDLIRDLAHETRSFVCRLASRYPGSIPGGSSFGGLLAAWWSEFCPPPNVVPPPEPPPFVGGQCDGVLYDVTYKVVVQNVGNCSVVIDQVSNVRLPGAIGAPIARRSSGSATTTPCTGGSEVARPFDFFLPHQGGEFSLVTNIYITDGGTILGSVEILSIERADSFPDTCGDLDYNFPLPRVIPPSEAGDTYTYVYDDSTEINIPISLVPVNNEFNLNLPVNVNLGGLNFQVDIGGINVGSEDNRSFNFDSSRRIINNFGSGSGGEGVGEGDLPGNDEVFEQEELPESETIQQEGLEKLAFVKVNLKTIPRNANVISGLGNAPNIYLAGWISFKTGQTFYPRQFVDYQSCIFVAPDGADGFALRLNPGYTGSTTIVTRRE